MYFGDDATFMGEIDLISAKLGQDFDLSGSTFKKDVDLTGAQIGGVLGLSLMLWLRSATFNLPGQVEDIGVRCAFTNTVPTGDF